MIKTKLLFHVNIELIYDYLICERVVAFLCIKLLEECRPTGYIKSSSQLIQVHNHNILNLKEA